MFNLHRLLDEYDREVVTRERWAAEHRHDMVAYCEDGLRRIRKAIEADMLDTLRRSAKP